MIRISTFIFCCLLFSVSTPQAQTFQDVGPTYGISQGYGTGGKGGGVSFYDFNGDGWDDLSFATTTGDSLKFWENQEGTLVPVILPGIGHTGAAEQLLWADYDNDGDADLFVTDSEGPNVLYEFDGESGYIDVTASAGISTASKPTYAACWGDIDLDGLLDLYVTNWGTDDPLITNIIYRNLGDGLFEDITERTNLANPNNPPLAVMFTDINHDRYPDIYITNDHLYGNTMFRNNGDETFTDISVSSGTDLPMDGMGVTAGDYDLDGDLDLYASNSPYGNALFRNEGNETFTELAPAAGVALYGTGWGVNFLDYDNDLDQDLYASAIYIGIPSIPSSTLFDNQGDGTFNALASAAFSGTASKSHGNALGDLDRDGYYDIAVNNAAPDNFQVWHNSGADNHWFGVKLEGVNSNRDGVGSWIELIAAGVRQIHFTHCGTSYLSQNSSRVLFGLAEATVVDSVIITWPNGTVDLLTNVPGDQTVTIVEGSSPVTTSNESLLNKSFHIFPNPASEVVQIQWQDLEANELKISVMNVQGQSIWDKQFPFVTSSAQTQLSVKDWAKGLYLLKIQTEHHGHFVQKLEIR